MAEGKDGVVEVAHDAEGDDAGGGEPEGDAVGGAAAEVGNDGFFGGEEH